LEPLVHKVQLDPQDLPVPKAFRVQLARKDRKAHKEQQDHKELRVLLVRKAMWVPQDHKACRVFKACRAILEPLALKALLEQLV
jgi:hypothetical protein